MENENENRDHNPLKDNQDDSWIIAALTTAFVAGVGATIAAIKLVSKLVNKQPPPLPDHTGRGYLFF